MQKDAIHVRKLALTQQSGFAMRSNLGRFSRLIAVKPPERSVRRALEATGSSCRGVPGPSVPKAHLAFNIPEFRDRFSYSTIGMCRALNWRNGVLGKPLSLVSDRLHAWVAQLSGGLLRRG